MGGEQDGDEGKFDVPELPLGDRGKVNLIDGKRTYHERSAYPEWTNKRGERSKPYFKIDSYRLTHESYKLGDGRHDDEMVREVFERGDSVGVLLYNRDQRSVIGVKQFRVATLYRNEAGPDGKPLRDGWIEETLAGEVKPKDKGGPKRVPKQVAIDETKEETGYTITDPELIATFFVSPGGTSEKIYLYFAEVTDGDSGTAEGGERTEDIEVVKWPLDVFSEKLRKREFVDPKLVIAGYYLSSRLGLRIETSERLSDGEVAERYTSSRYPNLEIRIKTGDILQVRDVDVWLNPENKYMLMARVFDEGISASIRWAGAKRWGDGYIRDDTIGNELRQAMEGRTEATRAEIIETSPGALLRSNNVRRLLHLAVARERDVDGPQRSVKQSGRERLVVAANDVQLAVARALTEVHLGNHSVERVMDRWREWFNGFRGRYCRSVLIPMIGAGEGRLSVQESVPKILQGITEFWRRFEGKSEVKTIYLIAYQQRDLDVCERELAKLGFVASEGSASDA